MASPSLLGDRPVGRVAGDLHGSNRRARRPARPSGNATVSLTSSTAGSSTPTRNSSAVTPLVLCPPGHLGVDDDGDAQQHAWFDEGVTWIEDVLADPAAMVLIHCHMGVNRAPSLMFAALLAAGWEPIAALKRIASACLIAAVLYAADVLTGTTGGRPR